MRARIAGARLVEGSASRDSAGGGNAGEDSAGRSGVTSRGFARLAAQLVVVAILGLIGADTLRQQGNNSTRVLLVLVAFAIGMVGWRYRSSLGTATAFVSLAIMWALSQDAESATAAVIVGALLAVSSVLLSWLAQPPVDVPAAGALRRAWRLVSVMAGSSAVGLLTLQFVERPPASRLVVLLGVVAVGGALGLLFAFGAVDRETAADQRR